MGFSDNMNNIVTINIFKQYFNKIDSKIFSQTSRIYLMVVNT